MQVSPVIYEREPLYLIVILEEIQQIFDRKYSMGVKFDSLCAYRDTQIKYATGSKHCREALKAFKVALAINLITIPAKPEMLKCMKTTQTIRAVFKRIF